MKKLKIGFVIILTALSLNLFSQVKLIFDTDFGGDADDLGALAMLHHLAAKGECELLSIMCWTTEQNAVPAIDAVNRFYKHPDVPIAVLYAVRNGLGIYWDRSENGVCLPDEVGGNKWQENRDGKHSYLKLKMSNNDMARLIESLMLGLF